MIKVSRLFDDDVKEFERFTMGIPFDSESIWFGASIRDIPCGILMARKDEDDPETCKIEILSVHPTVRRMGVATHLFDAFLKDMEKTKYKEIIFHSTAAKEQIQEIYLFLKNYGFGPEEITANVYSIDYEDLYDSGKIKHIVKGKNIAPKGIEILPLDKVNSELINSLKERVDIDYKAVYDPFPTNYRFKLEHINTFVAVANSNEIVAWLTGLKLGENCIYYKTLFVKKEYRHLALGLMLINSCIKNHVENYPNRYATLGVSLKNDNALRFISMYFNGVHKSVTHEFIFKRTTKS